MNEQVQNHILRQYDLVKKIGSGAYGHVWKVVDKKTNQIYALKKIFDAFQNDIDAQRTYREIMFLKQLNHENIIKLHKIIKAENNLDLYLIFQYMDADLHAVIRQRLLGEKHKKFIVYQIAKSLKYLHDAKIIHRDIKPSNLLINTQCIVKLCDFGLSRSIKKQSQIQQPLLITQYIATRWYRAPEILLGSNSYQESVDIWSFGCLIYQLYKQKPIFPGKSTLDQIQRVFTWTGIPTDEDIHTMNIQNSKMIIQHLSNIKRKKMKDWFFPIQNNQLISLMSQMLELNPKKRINIDEILKHPFLQQFSQIESILEKSKSIKIRIDDKSKLSLEQYRYLIYNEIDNNYRLRQFKQPKRIKRLIHNEKKKSANDIEKQFNSKNQQQLDPKNKSQIYQGILKKKRRSNTIYIKNRRKASSSFDKQVSEIKNQMDLNMDIKTSTHLSMHKCNLQTQIDQSIQKKHKNSLFSKLRTQTSFVQPTKVNNFLQKIDSITNTKCSNFNDEKDMGNIIKFSNLNQNKFSVSKKYKKLSFKVC